LPLQSGGFPLTDNLLPINGSNAILAINHELCFERNCISQLGNLMLTPRQIRAARGLLGWEATELGRRTSLSRETIANIESGRTDARAGSLERIAKAFDEGGIEFTANQGVRLKPSGLEVYEGPERFEDFYEFLYEQVRTHGGDVCLSVTDERLLAKYRKDSTVHYQRMQELFDRGVITSFRILANRSNFASKYPYNIYKWQPDASLSPTAFYTFGECLALISFVHDTPPYVVVLQSAPLASSYRQAFDAAWTAAKDPPKPAENK
jgi:transcriptional regulator with XRE-family HTH domain